MGSYLLRRLGASLSVLVLISVLVFMLLHLAAGDPASVMLGLDASSEEIAQLHRQLGLDDPLYVQYFLWVGNVIHGDLGHSLRTHQPVFGAIVERLPVTAELGVLAIAIALGIAVPAGILSAVRRNSWVDTVITATSLAGISIPNFFLAVLLIYVFAVQLRWLEPFGFVPLSRDVGGNIKSLVMPALSLGLALAAVVTRYTRASLLEVLGEDYLRTAAGKGLSRGIILRRHALKNALIPVTTVVGLQIAGILGGAVIVETVFALPGVGRLVLDSILQRNFPVVQGVVLMFAVSFLVVNLLVDLMYSWLDPRIRYS